MAAGMHIQGRCRTATGLLQLQGWNNQMTEINENEAIIGQTIYVFATAGVARGLEACLNTGTAGVCICASLFVCAATPSAKTRKRPVQHRRIGPSPPVVSKMPATAGIFLSGLSVATTPLSPQPEIHLLRPPRQIQAGMRGRRLAHYLAAADHEAADGAQADGFNRIGGIQHHQIGVAADLQTVSLQA